VPAIRGENVKQSNAGEGGAASQRPLSWTPTILATLFTLAVSIFFIVFPQVDLWFSGLFHEPGARFPLANDPLLDGLRSFGKIIVPAVGVAAVAALLLKLALPRNKIPLSANSALFLLWSLALGPGLIVNAILKANWGRPRPTWVIPFGGNLPFVDAWDISGYCTRNCSFVSGEGSGAMWLVALALIAPPAWRRPTAIVTAAIAFAVSLNRVVSGGHFLSDVLVGWGMTLTTIAVMYQLIVIRHPAWSDLTGLDGAAGRFAGRIREASLVQNVARVLVAAAGVAGVGFAIFGQSTWLQQNDLHETVEWIGAGMMAVCVLGLAWYAFAMPAQVGRRASGTVPGAGTLLALRIVGAIGVGAQFGSVAFALAAGTAVLAAFAFGLVGVSRAADGEAAGGRERGFSPVTVKALLATSLLLVLAIPVAEEIEHLQAVGVLHVFMRLP
jgi:membrane-associated PAP2 superfamily phosphatase